MKILQINKHHFIKGGADKVYFNTISMLEKHGHEVVTFSTLRPENYGSEYSGYFVPFVDNRNKNVLSNLFQAGHYLYNGNASKNLKRLIEAFSPEIAHLHLFYGDLSSSILRTLKQTGVPIVHSVHDYRLLCPANSFLDSKNQICEKCKNRVYFNCASKRCLEGNFSFSSILALEGYTRKYLIDPLDYIDRFIFVSKFAEMKHIEFDQRYAGKAEQLYNFTDLEEKDAIGQKGRYFLFFGRLVKEKGVETLLKAISTLDVSLIIAGSGPGENDVRKFASEHKNVKLIGHQSGSELKDLVKNAYFIIVPSEWYENNPMTIIEAYAAGVPVIASRIGGIPEIVAHEKTGFLFEPFDTSGLVKTIIRAARIDLDNYAKMSQNCKEFARLEFASEIHYNQLMRIYLNAMK
ncbi:MAG TPA: glycosyltransferase [Bacteroidales bacterium]|nr:glycosyltransferase [Bacteroidales bacterium]